MFPSASILKPSRSFKTFNYACKILYSIFSVIICSLFNHFNLNLNFIFSFLFDCWSKGSICERITTTNLLSMLTVIGLYKKGSYITANQELRNVSDKQIDVQTSVNLINDCSHRQNVNIIFSFTYFRHPTCCVPHHPEQQHLHVHQEAAGQPGRKTAFLQRRYGSNKPWSYIEFFQTRVFYKHLIQLNIIYSVPFN